MHIAHAHRESGGLKSYNESQRMNPQFLEALPEPAEFQTELGRKIHQKVAAGHVEEDAEFKEPRW